MGPQPAAGAPAEFSRGRWRRRVLGEGRRLGRCNASSEIVRARRFASLDLERDRITPGIRRASAAGANNSGGVSLRGSRVWWIARTRWRSGCSTHGCAPSASIDPVAALNRPGITPANKYLKKATPSDRKVVLLHRRSGSGRIALRISSMPPSNRAFLGAPARSGGDEFRKRWRRGAES